MQESIPPLPKKSGMPEAQGSGVRQQEAKKSALEKLKTQAEDIIEQEKIKVAQTSSPLNLGRIRKSINKYRALREIR